MDVGLHGISEDAVILKNRHQPLSGVYIKMLNTGAYESEMRRFYRVLVLDPATDLEQELHLDLIHSETYSNLLDKK